MMHMCFQNVPAGEEWVRLRIRRKILGILSEFKLLHVRSWVGPKFPKLLGDAGAIGLHLDSKL